MKVDCPVGLLESSARAEFAAKAVVMHNVIVGQRRQPNKGKYIYMECSPETVSAARQRFFGSILWPGTVCFSVQMRSGSALNNKQVNKRQITMMQGAAPSTPTFCSLVSLPVQLGRRECGFWRAWTSSAATEKAAAGWIIRLRRATKAIQSGGCRAAQAQAQAQVPLAVLVQGSLALY